MIGARTVKAQFFDVPNLSSLWEESPANQDTMRLLDRFSRIGLGADVRVPGPSKAPP
jgi:hypothetical protein